MMKVPKLVTTDKVVNLEDHVVYLIQFKIQSGSSLKISDSCFLDMYKGFVSDPTATGCYFEYVDSAHREAIPLRLPRNNKDYLNICTVMGIYLLFTDKVMAQEFLKLYKRTIKQFPFSEFEPDIKSEISVTSFHNRLKWRIAKMASVQRYYRFLAEKVNQLYKRETDHEV